MDPHRKIRFAGYLRLKDKDSIDADSLPEPDVLAAEAMGELVQALSELDALMRELGRAMRPICSVSCWKKRLVG